MNTERLATDARTETEDPIQSRSLRNAWTGALRRLSHSVNPATYQSYIKPIVPISIDEIEVRLGVESGFAREWLLRKYSGPIQKALESALGRRVSISFQVLVTEVSPNDTDLPAIGHTRNSETAGKGRDVLRRTNYPDWTIELNPDPKHSFERFVESPANQLALAAARSAAHGPSGAPNPLFLYGAPGRGKTHLLLATARESRVRVSDICVAYLNGEELTYHFSLGRVQRHSEDFKDYCAGIDILLVDDIQFVARNAGVREELGHAVHEILLTGKRLVVASDRSLWELGLDNRMLTRLESGLIAEVGAPDLAARMRILEANCREIGRKVSAEVIYFIANGVRSNVRALEGALTKLIAYSDVVGAPVTVNLAQGALEEYLIERPVFGIMRKGLPIETVLNAVAHQFNLRVEDLRGGRKDRLIARARQVAMLLCKELTGCGLHEIGMALGGRHHATVHRGIKSISKVFERSPKLWQASVEIREMLER